jgi:chromosome segregation ATPase
MKMSELESTLMKERDALIDERDNLRAELAEAKAEIAEHDNAVEIVQAEASTYAKSVQRLQKAFDDQCNASRMDAAEIERLKKENERLVELCTNVHDRLLRGDSDMDLLKMLCEGWQKAGGAIPVPDWLRERMERLAAQPKPSIERVRKQLRASGEQGGAE